jgi:predicted nuclease of predicted toxin-antitoxin system
MKFLADMGVSQRVLAWLRSQGHDAIHLRDEGLQRLPNGAIFEKAFNERRVILTFDLDFGEILALSRGRKVSVVLFRLRNARAPHVIERFGPVLEDSLPALEAGAVVVVEETRHRVRHLPIGSETAD